ncbi:MAG: DEAD/DEAH box helicase [Bacteroidales bacterium]|nr:DEAD/DEAH box helicase [Bacteroidales bacterium]
MEKQTFVVALLSFIKPIGYVILPYSCYRDNDNFITVHERLTSLNIGHYHELSSAESEFIKLTESFSNQAIIKQFSKKSQTPKDFFTSLDKNLLDELIRPFVERKLSKIIEILYANEIPFYESESTNLHPEDMITIEDESPQARLKFTRTNEGTQYKLRAYYLKKEIVLNRPGNKILANEPCWYLAENKLYRFPENINGKLLTPFQNKEFVIIPKHIEYKYFSTFIRKIANRCDIEAEGFQLNDLHLLPEAILSLEVGWQGRIVLILSFRYGDKVVLANHPQKTFTSLIADENGFIFNRFRRNLAWEAKNIAFLKSLNLKQVEATFLLNEKEPALYKGYQLIEWLSANRAELLQHSFLIKQPENAKYLLEIPVLNLEMQTGKDWFDLNGTVVLRNFEIPFSKFRNHIINNRKEYELPTGEIVILPDEWFSRYQEIMLYAKERSQSIRISKHHYTLLSSVFNSEVGRIEESLSSPEPVSLPELTNVTLRPYQLSGFYWMHSLKQNGLGGILADDMGLGKTLQTIALLASYYPKKVWDSTSEDFSGSAYPASPVLQLDLFTQAEAHPEIKIFTPNAAPVTQPPCSLIVLPASLIHNWLNEFSRFAPWLRIYIHSGGNRVADTHIFKRFDIILTTYGTMRNDIDMLGAFRFGYIILDESQTIKTPTAKATQAVFTLQGDHRMVLTGTPIQNSLSDIWSQFNFLNPEMLGTHQHFMKYYAIPLSKNQEDPVAEKLKKLINPFILRRTKQEVAPELPPITETAVFCEMTEEQQSLYETEKSKVRNLILENFESGGLKNSAVLVLRALTMLRQLANHPRMLDKGSDAGSGKFKEVTDSLETVLAENHKVLIFSSFVKHLNLVEEYCKEKSYKYALLTGSTTNREKVISSFKSRNDIQLFLISLKAGGVGLNLTEADYVFILDPWWNPAAEMQALNRAHRIGQDKNVFVYRFITKETVEEKIVQLQQNKKDLAEMFVPSDSYIAGMTKEEILEIFM